MDETLGKRFELVEDRIAQAARRSGRDTASIQLIAVTKTIPVGLIKEAIERGHRVFGENKVQEGVAKIRDLSAYRPYLQWHLIGHLQTNKAKDAFEAFDCIQSVDSVRLGTKLNAYAAEAGKRIRALIEVNVAHEPAKSGFSPEELRREEQRLLDLPNLDFRGFMTIAPLVSNPEEVRNVFHRLRELREEIQANFPHHDLSELSMGMTDDFEVAIEEGSTMVRIGRALFGDRPAVR